MLIDTERYVPGRKVANGQGCILPEPPEESIEAQISAGVTCLLAPSTFPTERDPASIRAALDAGHRYVEAARQVAPGVPAFVPIVIRFNELVDRRWVRPVAESGLPVATVFAGYGNPLSERGAIPGAVDLVDAAAAIMPLRCDTSVAGLLALGAVAGAIGSSSSVRHLYLPRRGRQNQAASRSMFVPAFANWLKVRFVKRAWADPDLDDLFVCECSVCGTRGDVRALTEPDVSNQMQDDHSIASAVKLIRSVVDADKRVNAWRDVCERALTAYQRLARYGFGNEGPTDRGVSQAWLDVVG